VNDEVQKTCPTCGVAYCLPARFDAERLEDHKSWYCPNGHSLHYPSESPKERRIRVLEEQVEWEQSRVETRDRKIAQLEHDVRSLRSQLSWARRRAA
jgi:DNA repair exonuclease SbcCD ATPase subunit